ncbi:MAG: DUF4147 domain-containing protein [Alphaproteobacteria bacterium]|nr:DUF4147 domain-containing protein [Alphaproteobacteria bacterium]MDD9919696.1 DUF4147 domain-containing protein [Alphaproteobacteria bacterium]
MTINYIKKLQDAHGLCINSAQLNISLPNCLEQLDIAEVRNVYVLALGEFAPNMEGFVRRFFTNHNKTYFAAVAATGEQSSLSSDAKDIVNIISKIRDAKTKDLVLVLLSDGAETAIEAPAAKYLEDGCYQDILDQLTAAKASIPEKATVTKYISNIYGGRLVQNTEAKVVTIALPYIAGNDLQVIGAGITCETNTDQQDVLTILNRYKVKVPEAFKVALQPNTTRLKAPTGFVKAGDQYFTISDGLSALEKNLEFVGKSFPEHELVFDNSALAGSAADTALRHIKTIHLAQKEGRKIILVGAGDLGRLGGTYRFPPDSEKANLKSFQVYVEAMKAGIAKLGAEQAVQGLVTSPDYFCPINAQTLAGEKLPLYQLSDDAQDLLSITYINNMFFYVIG